MLWSNSYSIRSGFSSGNWQAVEGEISRTAYFCVRNALDGNQFFVEKSEKEIVLVPGLCTLPFGTRPFVYDTNQLVFTKKTAGLLQTFPQCDIRDVFILNLSLPARNFPPRLCAVSSGPVFLFLNFLLRCFLY